LPLKLCPPDPKHPTWRVRGKYLGVSIQRSTGAREKSVAQKLLNQWKENIERGCYARPEDPTFASATLSYLQAGGEATYLEPLIEHFGVKLLALITQADIDAAAAKLYPELTDASRNRFVYTPVSAVMHHAGVPYGSQPTAANRASSGRRARKANRVCAGYPPRRLGACSPPSGTGQHGWNLKSRSRPPPLPPAPEA
jgi:hypothetical protein